MVLSSHGRGALARFWLGSNADELVRSLAVPVLLARPGQAVPDLRHEAVFKHLLLALDGTTLAEQIMPAALAIGSALVWLAVFVLLGIAELRCLVWLADGAPPGESGLATFSVVVIAVAMAALIVAPTLYFLVPLMLPLDVIPRGLEAAVGPKLGDQRARGFIKLALREFEGAVERAGEKFEAAQQEAAQALAKRLVARGANQPGFLVLNPCSYKRRVVLERYRDVIETLYT